MNMETEIEELATETAEYIDYLNEAEDELQTEWQNEQLEAAQGALIDEVIDDCPPIFNWSGEL